MGLTMTRPGMNVSIMSAAGEMRNALAKYAQAGGMNEAEALTAAAHVFASLLVGAYREGKNREIVIHAIPDLVRACIPQWEKIYSDFKRADPEAFTAAHQ